MDDPALFAGRSLQLENVARALHSRGSCPILYGDRGLGKSSLALQGVRIALGDDELLKREGHGRWALKARDAYVAVYVRCSDATATKDEVLQRVLNALVDSFGKQLWGEETYQLKELSTRVGINLKVASADFAKRYEPAKLDADYVKKNVEDKLVEVCRFITEATRRRVLIVIDELDRARNAAGLASFIKSSSSRDLKFMLVGIGQNLSDILSDHRSLERSAHPIEVPPMQQRELEAVVDQALYALREAGVVMGCEAPAKRVMARAASGFPWFVHVVGDDALLLADRDGAQVIQMSHVSRAMERLTQNRFAQQFADRYQMAVRDSIHREVVLRVAAKWNGQDIPTSEVYAIARDLGVSNPSNYKGHLCSEAYGPAFLTPAYQKQGILRFANTMFKVYVGLRPAIYSGVQERIDKAWENRYDD
jgi:Cdc6-like AAA superfamily ATPase